MLRDWQRDFARCLRDPADIPPALETKRTRFAVYRDSVTASLVAALGDAYPVTRMLVGDAFFDTIAKDYVRREPPGQPRLSAYGDTYPHFLRHLPALQDLPYVADVAQLEWARIEAYFTGPAANSVQPEMLLEHSTEMLPLLSLHPAPSLRVIMADTAVWTIWTAHQAAVPEVEGIDVRQPQAVRLSCEANGVAMSRISTGHAVFLLALIEGHPIAMAAETASAADGHFDLQSILVSELRLGSFSEISLPKGHD